MTSTFLYMTSILLCVQAVVTVPNDEQVEFGVGEYVSFKDVEGMTGTRSQKSNV